MSLPKPRARHWAALLITCVGLAAAGPRQAGEDAASLARQAAAALSQTSGTISVAGLDQPVEVIRDRWGVPHIYARTEHDLFFAQGYVAAQDRLWQIDLWRRNAEGTLAEVVGPSAVKRDTFARLLRYRGDMQAEWASYGADAKEVIEAFVSGINAQIAYVTRHPEKLPVEFQILGAKPSPWTPEVVLGRMAGYVMTRNARSEIQRARLLRSAGMAPMLAAMPVDPATPIVIPDGLDLNDIGDGILDIASDASEIVRFPDQLLKVAAAPRVFGPARPRAVAGLVETWNLEPGTWNPDESWPDAAWRYGSNNWVLSGSMTASGKPILANDPHRVIALPSLRYGVHLVGPGWNVIGAGEPALPGVAAGHNDRVAFGFTIVGIDQQDLYVERLDPERPDHYFYKGTAEPITIVREQVRVRGAAPQTVELRFTRHGPVLHTDASRRRAYVLRWVGTEPGTAGYLRSLALNRARSWAEFVEAAAGWKVPSENLVYADVDGNIGWIAAGLAPVRPNWNGLLPVPGQDGRYEWQGFLSIADLPQSYNPAAGYLATANHNILPAGYAHALQYEWGAPHRFNRIDEVLRDAARTKRPLTVADSEHLQHDATSLVARAVCRSLGDARAARRRAGRYDGSAGVPIERQQRINLLTGWNHVLDAQSAAAALYALWLPRLSQEGAAILTGKPRGTQSQPLATDRLLRLLTDAATDTAVQDLLLGPAIDEAWAEARRLMGPDTGSWQYGRIHRAHWEHPLASTPARRSVFNLPDVPRSGDGTTPLATGPGLRQTHGASFREVIDLADWDRSSMINAPGQSGQPGSPFYGNLLDLWAGEQHHPMLYSRQAVEANAAARLVLQPAR